MSYRFALAERVRFVLEGEYQLERQSARMRWAGRRTREKFAKAFALTAETDQLDKGRFRVECKAVGLSPLLIAFLLGVAWDILLELWRRWNPVATDLAFAEWGKQ